MNTPDTPYDSGDIETVIETITPRHEIGTNPPIISKDCVPQKYDKRVMAMLIKDGYGIHGRIASGWVDGNFVQLMNLESGRTMLVVQKWYVFGLKQHRRGDEIIASHYNDNKIGVFNSVEEGAGEFNKILRIH